LLFGKSLKAKKNVEGLTGVVVVEAAVEVLLEFTVAKVEKADDADDKEADEEADEAEDEVEALCRIGPCEFVFTDDVVLLLDVVEEEDEADVLCKIGPSEFEFTDDVVLPAVVVEEGQLAGSVPVIVDVIVVEVTTVYGHCSFSTVCHFPYPQASYFVEE
jgi:hypothetical protein